jgi:hypothetical protein
MLENTEECTCMQPIILADRKGCPQLKQILNFGLKAIYLNKYKACQ